MRVELANMQKALATMPVEVAKMQMQVATMQVEHAGSVSRHLLASIAQIHTCISRLRLA